MRYMMKNKDKYNLIELEFIPKSITNGCGKRVLGYDVEVNYQGKWIARIKCDHLLQGIMEWLEETT